MEIDFLCPNEPRLPEPPQPRAPKALSIIGGLLFIIGIIMTLSAFIPTFNFVKPDRLWQGIRSLSLASDRKLEGEKNDRVNVLLLGMGGEGHDGAYLTDTIILASLQPSNGKIALLSIPRDLLVPIDNHGWRRINNINAWAEEVKRGSGAESTRNALSQLLNISIPYVVRLDFEGFKNVIDELGGVRIQIDKSFEDMLYPDNNFGYAPVSFKAGSQTLSGDSALKFARSRHGNNGEGGDFARSRRQQKIITALKEKILSFDTLLRPSRVKTILETLGSHIVTNIDFWDGIRVARLIQQTSKEDVSMHTIDSSENGLLRDATVEGAAVLLPKNNDWEAIRKTVANILQDTAAPVQEKNIIKAVVEIKNGTTITGLAATTADRLERLGFHVNEVSNATERSYERTVIYDLTSGKKLDVLRTLQETLHGDVAITLPTWYSRNPNTLLDFLIVLGSSSAAPANTL